MSTPRRKIGTASRTKGYRRKNGSSSQYVRPGRRAKNVYNH